MDSPNKIEIRMDARTEIGMIKRITGSIFNRMSLGLTNLLTKSVFNLEFLDVQIIKTEIRNGAINPGTISSINR
jgi:hypothetical protein